MSIAGNPSVNPTQVPHRTVAEWAFPAARTYERPFADVAVDAVFTDPAGRERRTPAFHDGDGVWKVRFNPDAVGAWTFRLVPSRPDSGLTHEGAFEVTPRETRGFLRATPGVGWGFSWENGDPVFLFGDTTYDLFGMAHCGVDVRPFLQRRARQGFNLLRVRLPISPFYPPDAHSDWHTRRTWPWGGSEQSPLFDAFNLDYFRTVDEVVRYADDLGLGFEMVMEGWGLEFPFNSRQIFTAEWEELWFRWLIARYDAFASTCFWTPLNEYEYYPNGDWHYTPLADRWQMRVGRWIKEHAAHGHIVSAHNGPSLPPFAQRFAADPESVDAIMFQFWGSHGEHDAWLAAGIDEAIAQSLDGWWGSAVLAEWGYERNADVALKVPSHQHCDENHTRRGAWRAVFSGLGIIHGFENSWGPWNLLDQDQPGLEMLLHLHRFVTGTVAFHELRPAPGLVEPGDGGRGHRPLALATADRAVVVSYLPVGGSLSLAALPGEGREERWFDPRTGVFHDAEPDAGTRTFTAPTGGGEHPWDWVLLSRAVPAG